MPANLNNPYSQKRTPVTANALRGLCACCELPFGAKPRHENAGRGYCDPCRSHYEIHGESAERREERLTLDRKRVSEHYNAMRDMLNRNEGLLNQARDKVRSALGSRDHWKAKIDAIEKLHHANERGDCICGRRPCQVMHAIQYAEAPAREF
jgi:hypothetical protein